MVGGDVGLENVGPRQFFMVFFEELAFELGVGLERFVAEDMLNLKAFLFQKNGDHREPVAVERLGLGAHEGDPEALFEAFPHPLDPRQERLGLLHFFEIDRTICVQKRGIGMPCAEFLGKMEVGDLVFFQKTGERGLVEMRVVRARGHAPHVDQAVDAEMPEQVDEHLRRVVGVADGVYRIISHR